MRRPSILLVLLAVTAGVLGLVLPAWAASQNGVVIAISDGDTFTADVGSSNLVVRMTGINATETAHAAGEDDQCWSIDAPPDATETMGAQERLAQLIDGDSVSLSYQDDLPAGSGRRWRWTTEGGTDIGLKLLQEGLVLPFPHQDETAKNLSYMKAATTAAEQNVGLWDSNDCGYGPDQDNKIKTFVNWDADGTDGDNVNGEYVRFRNYGSDPVQLDGWWVRDSGTHAYWHFPNGATIPAGGSIRVYMGDGSNTSKKFYADITDPPVFENVDRTGATQQGDGAYLFDRDGDLRSYMMYPCVLNCDDALEASDLSVSVVYDPAGADGDNINGEYVRIKNTSTRSFYMTNYVLESYPYVYDFYVPGVSSLLKAGETMHVHVGTGGDSRLERHWDKTKAIFDNGGDYARVRTHDNITIECKDWGSISC